MNTEETIAGRMYHMTANGLLVVGDNIRPEFTEEAILCRERELGALDAPDEVPAGSHYRSGWGFASSSFSLRPWW